VPTDAPGGLRWLPIEPVTPVTNVG
jgi:hypothetical protein